MYKCINGWTKKKMLAVVKKRRHVGAAVGSDGLCMYRTENGNRCAVGLFIPARHPGLTVSGDAITLLEEYPPILRVNYPLTLTLFLSYRTCMTAPLLKETQKLNMI